MVINREKRNQPECRAIDLPNLKICFIALGSRCAKLECYLLKLQTLSFLFDNINMLTRDCKLVKKNVLLNCNPYENSLNSTADSNERSFFFFMSIV